MSGAMRALAGIGAVGLLAAHGVIASAAGASRTQVTTFVPAIPAGAARAGNCWTRSIAAPGRADAWRCMVGNEIYDPCFTPPQRAGIAVCDANPAERTGGFVLRLTQPLPKEATYGGRSSPWLVELQDRSVCARLTGTHALIGGHDVGYDCRARSKRGRPNGIGLIDESFRPGTVWTVRAIEYHLRDGRPAGPVTVVPLAAVWR